MTRPRTPARLARAGAVTALVVFAAVASGCARGGGGGAAADTSGVDSVGPPPTPAHARHQVLIQGFAFVPPALAVSAGDTVEWINRDIVPHTATEEGGRWSSDTLATGASWRRVFAERGGHAYACRLHPVMKGRLEVR